MKKKNIVLELNNVSKHYGKEHYLVKALDDVSLKMQEGDFTAITGPSGSGKSTMLHMIGLLDEPTHGDIYIDGINTVHFNEREKAEMRNKKIGFVFQMFNLIPSLTVIENVEIPQVIMGTEKKERREKANEILRKLGMEHRAAHFPNQLSGGEKQRTAIARALCNDPEIILADEPTGALDTQRGIELMGILKELNKDGKTVLIITHDPEIAKTAKKIIKLKDGRTVK